MSIIEDIRKLAKEPRRTQMFIFIAITPIVIISHLEFLQSLLGIAVPDTIKFTVNFIAFCLLVFIFLTWKKTEVSLDKNKIREEFESDEIASNIVKLTKWLRINSPEEYGKQINLSIEKQDLTFAGVDEARRSISNCFRHIWESYKEGNLTKKGIKSFVYSDGVDLLLNKIEPLEAQIGKNYKRDMFNFFRKLYAKN